MTRRAQRPSIVRVAGYRRVSTGEQVTSGAGLDAQLTTLEEECMRRGWDLAQVFTDAGVSGKTAANRPALQQALDAVEAGVAGVLMVSKLDRLSRSVSDASGLLDRAQRNGWALVACDLGVDTSTPAGEAMANIMSTFAQLERRLIGQRTREALAVKRAQGVRLGRPRTLSEEVVSRILAEHEAGQSWSAIGRGLDADGVPTAQGGARWYPATVRSVAMAANA